MTIEGGTAIVLAYVLVSKGVIIAFLSAVFVIEWFIGWLRQRRRHRRPGDTGIRTDIQVENFAVSIPPPMKVFHPL